MRWTMQYKYDGTIRIYLDGSNEPVLEAKADKLIGGDGITGPPLSAVGVWARNLYLPIPFNKYCKITYDGPNRIETGKFEDCLYYNINYLQYPKDTNVKTFTVSDLKTNSALIDKVQRELLQPEKNQLDIAREIKGGKTVLTTGQSITRDVDGGGAISSLRVKIAGGDIRQALRSTVISASFDGKQRVWVPAGEFFGTGLGINAFKGWWRQVNKDGWINCLWPMPFNSSLKFNMELSHWQTTKIDYATTCYWYAFDGAKNNGQVLPEKVRSKVGLIDVKSDM